MYEMRKFFLNEKNEDFFHFIHGGPGVGKTWTINEYEKFPKKKNKKDSVHWIRSKITKLAKWWCKSSLIISITYCLMGDF